MTILPRLVMLVLLCRSLANFTVSTPSRANEQRVDVLDISSSSSICFPSSGGSISGINDCTGGEIQLLGQFVNVGLHNVGSFGTTHNLDSSYYTSRLGIIADFDRNGFSASPSPSFSGDFSMNAFNPIEGMYFTTLLPSACRRKNYQFIFMYD